MLRTCVLCCVAAGLLGVAVGCNRDPDSTVVKAQRDELVAGYKTRLEDADKKLADLKDRTEKAAADEKPRLEGRLKEANARRDAFVKKYEELKTVGADKVETVKKDTEAAFNDYKKSVE